MACAGCQRRREALLKMRERYSGRIKDAIRKTRLDIKRARKVKERDDGKADT
jgi:hypothetical protein